MPQHLLYQGHVYVQAGPKDKVSPDEYHREHGKCPPGYRWHEYEEKCEPLSHVRRRWKELDHATFVRMHEVTPAEEEEHLSQSKKTYESKIRKKHGKWTDLHIALDKAMGDSSKKLLPKKIGRDWLKGGCLVFAEGFRKWTGKKLPMVLQHLPGMNVDTHVAVQIGPDSYVDAGGVKSLRQINEQRNLPFKPSLKKNWEPSAEYKKNNSRNSIRYSQETIDEVAKYLKKTLGDPSKYGFK